ncbi:hypothetical protein BLOT_013599, partial [Blomia tropicalis]
MLFMTRLSDSFAFSIPMGQIHLLMIHLRELINLHAIPLNVNGTNEYTNDEQSLLSSVDDDDDDGGINDATTHCVMKWCLHKQDAS